MDIKHMESYLGHLTLHVFCFSSQKPFVQAYILTWSGRNNHYFLNDVTERYASIIQF